MSTGRVAKFDLRKLYNYLPEETEGMIEPLLEGYSVLIKIKAARKSKFGDYKPLRDKAWNHQITMNNDLNPYAFLITLLHEIAHMYNYARYKSKVKPHGQEWKDFYSELMQPFVAKNIFPADLFACIQKQLDSPTASSCTDHDLFLTLKKYDKKESGLVLVETLAIGEHFKWRNGMVFKKEKKLRKRYSCTEIRSNRVYLFHPMAEVEKLNNPDQQLRNVS